jgi:hypothetical protein
MAIDQTTLSEEQPSPDVLRLLGGLESGEFYVPDESPYAGDWTDFGRMRRDRQRRKKFEEFDRSVGGPYATLPERFNLSELLPFGGFEKAVNRRDPLGVGFELASGVVPGSKVGIMGLAAIKNNPKYAEIIRELPKSVWKKMKTPLQGRILRDEGKAAFSYSNPAFAQKNYLEPVIGKAQAAKYEYTITHEGKHYFKHKNNQSLKSVNSADQRIKENLRLHYRGGVEGDKAAITQKIIKDADLVKVRKQRLQTEHAADDLHQLGDPTVPKEVKAATLERYKEYPEAVKLEAMKILKIEGGPAGGAGAGLPSLKGKYPNWFSPEEATRMDNLLTPIKGDIPIVNEFKEGYKLIHTTPNYNNIPKNKRLKNILTKKKLSALNPNEASVLKQNIMNVTEEELLQLRVLSVNDKKRHLQGYLKEIEREARAGFGKELDILDTILGGGGRGGGGGSGAGLPSLLNPARIAANRAKVAGETAEKTKTLYHRGPKGINKFELKPDKFGGNKNALFFSNKPQKSGFGDVLYKVEATLPAGSSVQLGNPSKELIKNLDIAIAKAKEPYAALVKQGGAQPFEVEVLLELRGILKGQKYLGGTQGSRALLRQEGQVRSLEPIQQEFLLSQGVKLLDGLKQFGSKTSIVLDPDILKIVK